MAESVFTRQPKPRMRQQRNNSVAPAPDTPVDDATDEAQLSIVPDADADDPTFDDVVDSAGPDAKPDQDAAPKDDPTPSVEPSDNQDGPAGSAPNNSADPAPTKKAGAAPQDAAETNGDEGSRAGATNGPGTAEPTPDDAQGATADIEPAQQAPGPAPAPTPAKKNGKASATKARTPAPTAQAGSGTALAVINPDGSVTVDPGTHLIDLRDVAAQDDPHALVDMLGALRAVTDSELRQHVTAEISAAITTTALRT